MGISNDIVPIHRDVPHHPNAQLNHNLKKSLGEYHFKATQSCANFTTKLFKIF